ncbi:MAG: PEP-CTERM sorting domain-containing protein [Isosphaeraceae bacterium]
MWLLGVALIAVLCWPARGDLIRPKTGRTYPDIAGDVVGSQTYTFDPASRIGTFQVVNSPQFIALGPTSGDLLSVTPDQDGTLRQTLQLKLDQNGKLVETADNRFQLYGSVVIGNEVYRGLLLEGRPTAFGAQAQKSASLSSTDVFDLNMVITGGKLAPTFGREAYFRVVPQSNSTFQGDFSSDFSGDRPLTNLRALQGVLPAAVPEPTPLVVLLAGGLAIGAARLLGRRKAGRIRSSPARDSATGCSPG